MRQPAKLPKLILNQFQDFLEHHPPPQFSNHLRRLLLEYMEKNIQTGFPVYFHDFLWALSDLFDLFDEIVSHHAFYNAGSTQDERRMIKDQY